MNQSEAARRRLVVPLATAVAVAVVIFGTVFAVRNLSGSEAKPGRHGATAPPAGPPRTFLTVRTTPVRLHGDYLVRYPVSTLQLRSAHGGRLISTLLRSLGGIDAVDAPNGSVVAVVNDGCRSQVWRVNPRTDARTLIRTIPQTAQDVALSPDGRELAYLTYPASNPQHCAAAKQPLEPVRIYSNPGGLPGFLPNVLAVLDLASGAVVRAATDSPGNPPFGLAWSPDGSQIATVLSGKVDLLSASHPDFATARQIRPRHGCGDVTVTWTIRGLLAVEGCGKVNSDLSPRILMLMSPTGQQSSTWRLPACIDGVGLNADPTLRHVLVVTDIGYGNARPCGVNDGNWTTRVAEVRRSELATVAVFSQYPDITITGW